MQEEVIWVWRGGHCWPSSPLPKILQKLCLRDQTDNRKSSSSGKNDAGRRMKQDKLTSWFFVEVLSTWHETQKEWLFSHPQPCSWVNKVVACCFGESLWCLSDFPRVIITGIFYNPKGEAEPARNQVAKRSPKTWSCGEPKRVSMMPWTRSC